MIIIAVLRIEKLGFFNPVVRLKAADHEMEWQTVYNQMRQLLLRQSDLYLHCLRERVSQFK